MNNLSAKEVVIEVMRHFGFRRNYQVAKYFDVTPQTLSGWIKAGEIPPKHLIKFSNEILEKRQVDNTDSTNKSIKSFDINEPNQSNVENIKKIIKNNIYIMVLIPSISVLCMILYLIFLANPVYTSNSKVLPISEDGSSSNSFSGFASQLGINIPLNIGGKVPWDEIYPEILKSGDLLISMLDKEYKTDRYGKDTLKNILIKHYNLSNYDDLDQTNRVIDVLRSQINITKQRSSPIVNISIFTFEPFFSYELSKELILKSSLIQRQLKTNRIKKKRLFIEERLAQVSNELEIMEDELRLFRENNRNLSTSPSLQMKVQELGRKRDLQNSLYVTLKTQYEKAKIDEVGRDDMVQQIDGPNIPTKLTSPRPALYLIISIFFGVFSTFFIVYVKEYYTKEKLL